VATLNVVDPWRPIFERGLSTSGYEPMSGRSIPAEEEFGMCDSGWAPVWSGGQQGLVRCSTKTS